MTNEVKNVPELRFPGFKDEWEEKPLKNIVNVRSGKDYKHLNKGQYPVYGTGGYMISVDEYLYDGDAIGIGRKGTINKPYLLKGPFWTVDTLFYCVPKKNNTYFILSLFKNINWKIYDESTGVPSLSKVTINKILRKVPANEEQQKIGDFFSKLDRQIELEEQKLEKLEEQKKGYMQKVFTQELRFTDDNGNEYPNWEKEEIQDLMEVTSVKRIHQSDWQSNGVPFLRARDIVAYNKGEEIKEPLFISYDKYNEHSSISGKVEKGDLLVTGVGTIGVPFLIKDNTPLYFKDGNIIWLKNRGNLDENFLFYSFLNANIQNYIKRVAGVGTVGTYTIANAKKTPIFEPTKLEQEKIGNFFINLDSIIEKQSSKVELLKHRKQGLLQKMFV